MPSKKFIALYLLIGTIFLIALNAVFYYQYEIPLKILIWSVLPNYALAIGFYIQIVLIHKTWKWLQLDEEYKWDKLEN